MQLLWKKGATSMCIATESIERGALIEGGEMWNNLLNSKLGPTIKRYCFTY